MIMRITAKLGKKIGKVPLKVLPLEKNPYADWSAHLFYAGHAQYILITNTVSLYSMVMFGKGITTDYRFLDQLTLRMSDFIRWDGHEVIYERLVIPSMNRFFFSKALNQTVTGSMNDLVRLAKHHLADGTVSPFDVSFLLNKTPMKSLKFLNPKEAFKKLGEKWGIGAFRFV
jgi:hypothetical protein